MWNLDIQLYYIDFVCTADNAIVILAIFTKQMYKETKEWNGIVLSIESMRT